MGARLRLADLLAGLSIVVDLGYGLPTETAMRSCLVGTALARRMGLTEREASEVFYVSLLLHVGCMAYSHETNVWFGDDAAVHRAAARTTNTWEIFTVGPPGTPGPFAFADGDHLERTMRAGGFHDITLEVITRPIRMGGDVDDVTAFITSLPESQRLFAGKPAENVAAAVAALREGFAPHARPGGVVVNSSAWLASARR